MFWMATIFGLIAVPFAIFNLAHMLRFYIQELDVVMFLQYLFSGDFSSAIFVFTHCFKRIYVLPWVYME